MVVWMLVQNLFCIYHPRHVFFLGVLILQNSPWHTSHSKPHTKRDFKTLIAWLICFTSEVGLASNHHQLFAFIKAVLFTYHRGSRFDSSEATVIYTIHYSSVDFRASSFRNRVSLQWAPFWCRIKMSENVWCYVCVCLWWIDVTADTTSRQRLHSSVTWTGMMGARLCPRTVIDRYRQQSVATPKTADGYYWARDSARSRRKDLLAAGCCWSVDDDAWRLCKPAGRMYGYDWHGDDTSGAQLMMFSLLTLLLRSFATKITS